MIVCGGEALIDMIPCRTGDGATCFSPHAGGAVFNTAIALGRLGMPTGLVAGISSDLFGSQLRDILETSRVSLDLLVTRDLPTTLAFVTLKDGQARYAFYDENTAGGTLTADLLPELPAPVAAIFIGGISLINEPCGSAFETLASRHAGDAVIMTDANIRPSLVSDEGAYRRRLGRLSPMADIVKLSDEDIDWLVEGTMTPEEYAHRILGTGARLVIVTRGPDGATAYTRDLAVGSVTDQAEVIDTVGAGDAFNAGILTSLARQGLLAKPLIGELSKPALETALEFANSVAAISVSRQGADPPWLSELPASAH